MGRKWNELLSSAPWRTGEAAEDEDAARMSREGKVSVTSNPEEMPTMSVPWSRRPDLDLTIDDFEEDEIDPELRYSFQRNSRVPLLVSSSPFWGDCDPVPGTRCQVQNPYKLVQEMSPITALALCKIAVAEG
ncbi:uncharacterized protein [Zea mays]|uniref:uncharacterized protein n=1 Tax=Zea mays TaxID=4577 RepID=UPI0009A96908|nr:uncharacterized protein LOC103655052 [Zea mays]|eukprot:XP_008680087.2 uncharacterized protein LOC103655052 [Zea mays]